MTWLTLRMQDQQGQQLHRTLTQGLLKDNFGEKIPVIFLQKKKKIGPGFSTGPGHVLCEGKVKYPWGHGNGKWPGQWVRSLERKKKKRMIETRKSGARGRWMDIWEQAQSTKSTASHVNAPQKAPTTREARSHLADKVTSPGAVSFGWCPPQGGHSAHASKEWQRWRLCVNPQQHGLPFTKADLDPLTPNVQPASIDTNAGTLTRL